MPGQSTIGASDQEAEETTMPADGSTRGRGRTSTLIALFSFALFSTAWLEGISGGVSLVGAERVLAGEVPYRDFWTIYAPGHFYLLAGLFGVFGRHVIVSTIASSVLAALSAALVYRWLRPWVRDGRFAVAAALVLAASLYATAYPRWLNHYTPTLVLIVIALTALGGHLRGAGRHGAFRAGLAVGLAALFKHDVAAYTALVVATGFAAGALASPGSGRARSVRAARDLAALGLGIAVPVVPVAAALAWTAGADVLQDLIVFPAGVFRHTRPEAFPSLLPLGVLQAEGKVRLVTAASRWLYFALPPVVSVAAVVALARAAWRRRDAETSRTVALAAALAAGFGLHWAAAHVQINTHLVTMTLYAAALGALALARVEPGKGRVRRGLIALLILAWMASLASGIAMRRVAGGPRARVDLPKVGGARMTIAKASRLETLTAYVHERLAPGRPIFIGKRRHDVILVGDPEMYFVLDRPSATRYHELHPGVADTETVQAEMVADLEAREVELLVLKTIVDPGSLDAFLEQLRPDVPGIGATVLDRYIKAHYAPEASFGPWEVWLRRDAVSSGP
jgi:hypothetical protein